MDSCETYFLIFCEKGCENAIKFRPFLSLEIEILETVKFPKPIRVFASSVFQERKTLLQTLSISKEKTMQQWKTLFGIAVITLATQSPLLANNHKTSLKRNAKEEKKIEFVSVWRMEVPAATTHIAVADVNPDKKPRLITLSKDNKIVVHDLTGEKPKEEATLDAIINPRFLFAGHFSKNKEAVITTAKEVFYYEGGKFLSKKIMDLDNVYGKVHFSDGTESLCDLPEVGAPHRYTLEITAKEPLLTGDELPDPDRGTESYRSIVIYMKDALTEQLKLPKEALALPMLGFWYSKIESSLFTFLPYKDKEGAHLGFIDFQSLRSDPTNFRWMSPKFNGKLLHFTVGTDPKEGKKTGIFVLLEEEVTDKVQKDGKTTKKLSLEFFTEKE